MDFSHSYWKYAELVNGRLAMLGLVIGVVNYGLFGWIAPGLFKMKFNSQFTITKGQTHDSRSRKV